MKHLKYGTLIIIALVIGKVIGQEGEREFRYVGVNLCKTCHQTQKRGNQYELWLESEHARAYETLLTDTAKKIAKSLGISDPTKSPECLKCHTTAFGEGGFDPTKSWEENTKFLGVQCEECHGPGSVYRKKDIMIALYEGKIKPSSVGLKVITEKTCTKCHTPENNPTFKGFDYETYLKLIEHPVPLRN